MATKTVSLADFPEISRRKRIRTDFLRRIYGRATNNDLALSLANRRYQRALKQLPVPESTAATDRIAADLRANGIAFGRFDEIFDASFLDVIHGRFDAFLEAFLQTRPNDPEGKATYQDTIHKAHLFKPSDPVSDYCAHPAFALIAAKYMNMVPRFVGSSFWRTRPPPDGERIYSQLWHRDYNDRLLTKVFLYLNDVGDCGGYFEYVAGTQKNGRYHGMFDRTGPDGLRAYPDNAEVEAFVAGLPSFDLRDVPPDWWTSESAPWHSKPAVIRCQAPRGTLIFADTFGIHRGGHVQEGLRDMIMTTYSTNLNVHKPHFSVSLEYAETLSPFMRMTFGLD